MQQVNRLLTKTEHKSGAVIRALAFLLPGGGVGVLGGTPYNGLYGEPSTFFVLQVYGRVGLLLFLCLAERFFSECSGFRLSPKTNASRF